MMQDEHVEAEADATPEQLEVTTSAEAEAEEKPRPRSESWLARFGKSVKKIGKDIGDGTRKLGKQIGDGTKKVFAPKKKQAAESGGAVAEGDGAAASAADEAAPQTAGGGGGARAPRPKFPAAGSRAATPYGDGTVISLGEDGRAVVALDWRLADGEAVKAYLAADLLKRPVPKFIKGAGKVMHKVGDAIAGNNGIFGRNTWANIGDAIKTTAGKATHGVADGVKKAGNAIRTTADKAADGVKGVFKKRAPDGEAAAQEGAEPAAQEGEEAAAAAAAPQGDAVEAKDADGADAVVEEGTNPYAN